MACKRYKVSFTRKGKRLKTFISFNKKLRANAYANSLNKNLRNARARVIKDRRK